MPRSDRGASASFKIPGSSARHSVTEVAIFMCTVTAHTVPSIYASCNMFHMTRAVHQLSHSIFQPDLSAHMLDVPKSRPRFDWFLLAIVAGAVLALAVFAIANLIFQWSVAAVGARQ
jgi:hypothetical protein